MTSGSLESKLIMWVVENQKNLGLSKKGFFGKWSPLTVSGNQGMTLLLFYYLTVIFKQNIKKKNQFPVPGPEQCNRHQHSCLHG